MVVTLNRAAGPGHPAQRAFAGAIGVALALVLGALVGCENAGVRGKVPDLEPGPMTTRAPDAAPVDPSRPDPAPSLSLPDAREVSPPDGSTCESTATADKDQDGYSVEQGDCNDCDKQVNPGAFDLIDNKVDEDCSGTADDEPLACDQGLPLDGDALAAAKGLGLCRTATAGQGKERTWGLIKAAYVFPDGTSASLKSDGLGCARAGDPPHPRSHGVLPSFGPGVQPRQGASLVALSSGIARAGVVDHGPLSASPEGAEMCTRSRTPMAFPVSSYSTCGEIAGAGSAEPVANDAIALELVIRVPSNASSLSFDFNFFTYEYSEYICSEYNDAFVALLYSKSPDVPANHNIAFDSQRNPVSVNNGFLEVCKPFTYEGRMGGMAFRRPFPCALGIAQLQATGFEDHAATGWLQTRTNVVPGEELTLRLAIWDAGDEVLDSTVLIDNFKWDVKPGTTVTVRPPIE